MGSPTFQRMRYKLSPAAINAYYRCPRKFDYRYIHKKPVPHVFKPFLMVGGATHKALAAWFGASLKGIEPLPVAQLAADYVQRETPAEFRESVAPEYIPVVLEQMENAIATLPTGYHVTFVETEMAYPIQVPEVDDSIAITSKVDLVIQLDEDHFDHIDFKTGKQAGDLFQNVISRVTVKHRLDQDRRTAGLDPLPSDNLRTVNLLTPSRTYGVVPSDRAAHATTWDSIRETIGNIGQDDEWVPRPDRFICRLCEFNMVCDRAELGEDE